MTPDLKELTQRADLFCRERLDIRSDVETMAAFAKQEIDRAQALSVEKAVGIVMKNSGGSANPHVVEKVIRALNGERVSFIPKPDDR